MALQLAKWRARKFNIGDLHDLPGNTLPPWVHHPDPHYVNIVQPKHMADWAQSMPVPLAPPSTHHQFFRTGRLMGRLRLPDRRSAPANRTWRVRSLQPAFPPSTHTLGHQGIPLLDPFFTMTADISHENTLTWSRK